MPPVTPRAIYKVGFSRNWGVELSFAPRITRGDRVHANLARGLIFGLAIFSESVATPSLRW